MYLSSKILGEWSREGWKGVGKMGLKVARKIELLMMSKDCHGDNYLRAHLSDDATAILLMRGCFDY